MKKIISLIVIIALIGCKKNSDVNDVFVETDAEGCSDFGVYTFNSGKSVGIAVYGDPTELTIDETEKSFDLLGMDSDHLSVVIKEFSKGGGRFFCGDLGSEDFRVVHRWFAESGTVSIQVTDSMPDPNDTTKYTVNVSLQNITFKHQNKDKYLTLDQLNFTGVNTGGIEP